MKKNNYTFVLLHNKLSCYRYIDDQWKVEPIEEKVYLQLDKDKSIYLLNKLNQRHHSEHKLGSFFITLIRNDESSADFVGGFAKAVKKYNCTNWQVLFLESLLTQEQISLLDFDSIVQDLLPKTRSAEYLENIMGKNEESIELKLQIQQLEQDKERLLKDIQQAKMQQTPEPET
ncbi:MAG: hypothetical protein KAH22_05975, partial [Thiotrichaceae bacterium]|nr:hypothetical protein [Thiotrichaceae bacterium]